jgi:nucleoside-diphosphate-sugar epimerase
MMTDGTEQRQMLYSSDCVECLYELSKHYTELPRDREYHITSFEWTSIREIAEIIAEYYGDISIIPSSDKDVGQKDKRNEPDNFILKYWGPKISIKEGILKVIKRLDNAKNY